MNVGSRWLAIALAAGTVGVGCGSSSSNSGQGEPAPLAGEDAGVTPAGPDASTPPDASITCRPAETVCAGTFGEACCTVGFQCNSGACAALTPPSMAVARVFAGMAAGKDGKIYVIGGGSAANNQSQAAEAFDPVRNTWSSIAPLPVAPKPNFTSAAAGKDGRIYAWAGTNGFVYDPTTNAWTDLPPIPAPRDSLALAAGTNGKIYAIGGFSVPRNKPVTDVHAYDPTTNAWTAVASMHDGRTRLAAATGPDGRIYALGGTGETVRFADVEVYDPTADTWTVTTPMATARTEFGAAFGPDGKLYAIGGFDGAKGLDTVEVYDPATRIWTAGQPLPIAREGTSAATMVGSNGLIYVVGGNVASVLAYSTERGAW